MSWEDAWQEGRTGWDAGESPPILRTLLASGELPEGRALVPGAGAGYDVLTLADDDREVVGLDIAPTAARRFEDLRSHRGVSPEQASLRLADFFEFEPEAPFDLIWDYTFLCAIEPERRGEWAERVDELLAEDGRLVTLLFPVDPARPPDEGPPYRLDPDEVRALLSPGFVPTRLEPVDASHPGRAGKEWIGIWHRP